MPLPWTRDPGEADDEAAGGTGRSGAIRRSRWPLVAPRSATSRPVVIVPVEEQDRTAGGRSRDGRKVDRPRATAGTWSLSDARAGTVGCVERRRGGGCGPHGLGRGGERR